MDFPLILPGGTDTENVFFLFGVLVRTLVARTLAEMRLCLGLQPSSGQTEWSVVGYAWVQNSRLHKQRRASGRCLSCEYLADPHNFKGFRKII